MKYIGLVGSLVGSSLAAVSLEVFAIKPTRDCSQRVKTPSGRLNEVCYPQGVVKDLIVTEPPSQHINTEDLPNEWRWDNVNGTSYVTKNLNQHIPQYCGSCWAHGAISQLGDRIKIARKGKGVDRNLSVQHVLNCGNAGSCYGGDQHAAYQWIHQNGFVAYDTENPYMACSSDSKQGFCGKV